MESLPRYSWGSPGATGQKGRASVSHEAVCGRPVTQGSPETRLNGKSELLQNSLFIFLPISGRPKTPMPIKIGLSVWQGRGGLPRSSGFECRSFLEAFSAQL